MKKHTIACVLFLLLVWQLLAWWMNNDFLFPYPNQVIAKMIGQVSTPIFYESIYQTILRSTIGLCIAGILAFICSYLSYRFMFFREFFYPILVLIRSVPTICFLILVLLWFGSNISAIIVTIVIIFPVVYSSLYAGYQHIDQDLINVIRIYPENACYLIRKVYIPLLQEAIQASLSNGISLAFKVGVMSEIVGQVQSGIGRQLNIHRLTPDMAAIFAWTLWIVLMLVCFDYVLNACYRNKKRLQGSNEELLK